MGCQKKKKLANSVSCVCSLEFEIVLQRHNFDTLDILQKAHFCYFRHITHFLRKSESTPVKSEGSSPHPMPTVYKTL